MVGVQPRGGGTAHASARAMHQAMLLYGGADLGADGASRTWPPPWLAALAAPRLALAATRAGPHSSLREVRVRVRVRVRGPLV